MLQARATSSTRSRHPFFFLLPPVCAKTYVALSLSSPLSLARALSLALSLSRSLSLSLALSLALALAFTLSLFTPSFPCVGMHRQGPHVTRSLAPAPPSSPLPCLQKSVPLVRGLGLLVSYWCVVRPPSHRPHPFSRPICSPLRRIRGCNDGRRYQEND